MLRVDNGSRLGANRTCSKKTRTARTYSVQFVNELFNPVLRIDSSKRSDSKERISALRVRECEKDRQKDYKAKSVITGRLDVNNNICIALRN